MMGRLQIWMHPCPFPHVRDDPSNEFVKVSVENEDVNTPSPGERVIRFMQVLCQRLRMARVDNRVHLSATRGRFGFANRRFNNSQGQCPLSHTENTCEGGASPSRTRSEYFSPPAPQRTPPPERLKPNYRPRLVLHGHEKPVSQARISPLSRYSRW